MPNSAAIQSQIREVEISRNGDIHVTDNPNTEPGFILDSHGDKVTPKASFMERADEKIVTKQITMSRGLATIVSIVIGIGSIFIYSMTTAMGYQTVVNRVGSIETRVEKVEKALDNINALQMQSVTMQNDIRTMREKQVADEQDRKDLIKNVSDIRILLAQKQMGNN